MAAKLACGEQRIRTTGCCIGAGGVELRLCSVAMLATPSHLTVCAQGALHPLLPFHRPAPAGNTLDMIPNDITLKTPASFEPSIDYVVTKIPRFAFEKFPGAQVGWG